MHMVEEVVKKVDNQGRIVLPKKWRETHLKNAQVKLSMLDGEINVQPYEPEDIRSLFGVVKVDLKNDRTDWRKMKKELLLKKYREELR